ncbi:glutathione gamma-glutamylcysteinyltransferase [Stylonychia lemnae]|uniref:glutathione gamma-glutamylcysteinyltransferase n=1 Tax=Stylonychia lemnae TaxID=5949 RepID=A0A078AMJ2_STYLE|nr:glutathione gamma-glutamylcysteinyltransferase [Stylonychia lemnae]|eukprot:CDW83605.1 glutathione gamma-glutamylcysteinyltransferase [Stylonychia lemnae]
MQQTEKAIQQTIQTIYRRQLPAHLISFSSTEGKKLFLESMMQGTMEDYFNLAEQYTTQAEPEYCGPASLIMVLNALNIDPSKPWKGIWRWFTEEVLHCSTSEMMKQGLNLEQLTMLARCNGLHTQTFRPLLDPIKDPRFELIDKDLLDHKHHDHSISSESCCSMIAEHLPNNLEDHPYKLYGFNVNQNSFQQQFHTHKDSDKSHHSQPPIPLDSEMGKMLHHNTSAAYIKRFDLNFMRTAILSTSRRQGLYLMANISRKTLLQTGDGHFTPIGGYHISSDKVLLFDTARYKYPPHWVDINSLFEATQTIDSDTNKLRGIIAFSSKLKLQQIQQKIFSTVTVDYQATQHASKLLCQQFRPQIIADNIEGYKEQFNCQLGNASDLDLKLKYILNILNDKEIRSIFFVYFHELINRFAFEDYIAYHRNDLFYLSEYFQSLVYTIKLLPSAIYLMEREEYFKDHEFIKMAQSFIPGYETLFCSMVLHALPKQIFYRLRISGDKDSKNQMEENFWNLFLNEELPPIIQNEIMIIRYHLDIKSEYCHISDYSDTSTEHTFNHFNTQAQSS